MSATGDRGADIERVMRSLGRGRAARPGPTFLSPDHVADRSARPAA